MPQATLLCEYTWDDSHISVSKGHFSSSLHSQKTSASLQNLPGSSKSSQGILEGLLMFCYSSCLWCPLWKPACPAVEAVTMNTGCQCGQVDWLAERREREDGLLSDDLCSLGNGPQCLEPQSHSLTCIQSLPYCSTQITCSRAPQNRHCTSSMPTSVVLPPQLGTSLFLPSTQRQKPVSMQTLPRITTSSIPQSARV